MPGVSIFKDVPLVPTAHAFHVNQQYKDDTNPNKVNLGIGGKVSLYFSLVKSGSSILTVINNLGSFGSIFLNFIQP